MTKLIVLIFFALLKTVVVEQPNKAHWQNSVYDDIRQDPELNGFNIIVRNNSAVKQSLQYDEVTVFVPENSAFRRYKGELYSDLAFYHVIFKAKTVEELATNPKVTTLLKQYPPLWITAVDNDNVYINDAKILIDSSNIIFRSRNNARKQVLHVIDGILDPAIRSPKFSPNAYDFIATPINWDVATSISVTSFFSKVQEENLEYVFKQPSGHTYFVPLNFGVDVYKFNKLDKKSILGHVIPYYVLFTRPTKRDFAFESLANDDSFYVVLSFVESNRKLYVKAVERRSGKREEFFSEIIVRNIPVKNGVIHLISKPLLIPNRPLKPFPYLPIMSKLSSDPNLDIFFKIGEVNEFNKIFNRVDVSFTYFIPRDNAWKMARNMGLDTIEDDLTILKRHLIVSESPYSIEQLEAQTKANNNTFIELKNEEGVLRIMVLKIEGIYYVKWYNKYIEVIRPNYECTNGIVHILAGPMANFRRSDIGQSVDVTNALSNVENSYLKVIKKVFKKIVN